MRRPVASILFALAALLAAPVLGAGGQLRAGTITAGMVGQSVDAQLFGGVSLLEAFLGEGRDFVNTIAAPAIAAVDSLLSESPIDFLFEFARNALALGVEPPPGSALALVPVSNMRIDFGSDLDVAVGCASAVLPDLLMAYSTDIACHLLDAHLASLFRPPR